MRADTPPDDGIFATLDRQHVEAALAAERVTSARWRQGSAGRERGAKWKQQAALIALVDALERERRLAATDGPAIRAAPRLVHQPASGVVARRAYVFGFTFAPDTIDFRSP